MQSTNASRCHARLLAIVTVFLAVPSARADLLIEKPLVNLGDIKGGVPLQHRLELRNSGEQATDILEVTASCGCLAPRLDKRSLQPGEKTTLALELRPLGQRNGPHAWNGLVRYRQGQEVREAIFTVKAIIHNDVTVQPTV